VGKLKDSLAWFFSIPKDDIPTPPEEPLPKSVSSYTADNIYGFRFKLVLIGKDEIPLLNLEPNPRGASTYASIRKKVVSGTELFEELLADHQKSVLTEGALRKVFPEVEDWIHRRTGSEIFQTAADDEATGNSLLFTIDREVFGRSLLIIEVIPKAAYSSGEDSV